MNIESKFSNGLRVTDKETMNVVQMVLAGKVNKGLVADLIGFGGRAIGLCGVDGELIQVHKKNEELGYVGEVDKIDPKVIDDVISKGYIPVISSVGCDAEGNVLRDVNDPNSLISKITLAEAEQLKKEGIIAGGMIPKVDCCLESINAGAQKVFIINGEIPHAILIELLTDEGLGTMFVK